MNLPTKMVELESYCRLFQEMEALTGYDSDFDDKPIVDIPNKITLNSKYTDIDELPSHVTDNLSVVVAPSTMIPNTLTIIPKNLDNLPLANLPGEIFGPKHPFKQKFGSKLSSTANAAIDNYTFDEQYQQYQRSGYAIDSTSNTVLGDYDAYVRETIQSTAPLKRKRNKMSRIEEAMNLIEGDEDGPWVAIEKIVEDQPPVPVVSSIPSATQQNTIVEIKHQKQPEITNKQKDSVFDTKEISDIQYIIEPEEEEEKWERIHEKKSSFTLPPRPPRGSTANPGTTTFHGQSEKDFLGRPWTVPPAGVRPVDNDHNCYIPKKCIKKYLGHNKGVNTIEFIPGTGHLLLSASIDGKCKIWDVFGDRNVKRTYIGHIEAVRSASFDYTGTQFLSSSFDRYIRLWDVETGQIKSTFSNRKMSYQAKFHPKDSNVFLAPAHDNKIYQWDVRSGTISQQYNYHLQSANAIVFFDDGRKFMSSSDDKKLMVWEFDIPVPITYISEPEMYSMPYLAEHPSGQFLVGQSMDNSIPVFACGEVVKPVKKRVFRGHSNGGYACQIGFSPNGKTMMSGDGFGKLCFWDWKSMTLTRKFQAHDGGPCLGAQWHPVHPSWIVTCGWDGTIKLWEYFGQNIVCIMFLLRKELFSRNKEKDQALSKGFWLLAYFATLRLAYEYSSKWSTNSKLLE